MKIGTAMPTRKVAAVKHHFMGNLSVTDYYSIGQYETDALQNRRNFLRKKTPSFWLAEAYVVRKSSSRRSQ